MNKLISRNPVERFKLGKSIRKMLTAAGGSLNLPAVINNPVSSVPATTIKPGLPAVKPTSLPSIVSKPGLLGRASRFIGRYAPAALLAYITDLKRQEAADKLKSGEYTIAGGKMVKNDAAAGAKVGIIPNKVPNHSVEDIKALYTEPKTAKRRDYGKGEVEYAQRNGIWYAKWTDPTKPNQGYYRVAEGSTGYNRAGDHNVLRNGKWVKMLELNSIPVAVTNRTSQPRFWNKYNYRTEDIGADKIKEWQRKLGVKDDGIWGDITESAYLKYLDLNKPSLKPVPQVEVPKESPVQLPTYVTAPTNRPTIAITQRLPTAKVFNRADTRDFIRNKGFGAYDFTGSLRKALRKVLNGQGTDEDLAVVKAMGLFKLGGQLPSRNIVERFKLKIKK